MRLPDGVCVGSNLKMTMEEGKDLVQCILFACLIRPLEPVPTGQAATHILPGGSGSRLT